MDSIHGRTSRGQSWKCIRMQYFAFAISKFYRGWHPQTLVAGGATPSRTFPQHGAGLRRRCCHPHVTPVLGAYILRASSVSETFRRPCLQLSTDCCCPGQRDDNALNRNRPRERLCICNRFSPLWWTSRRHHQPGLSNSITLYSIAVTNTTAACWRKYVTISRFFVNFC